MPENLSDRTVVLVILLTLVLVFGLIFSTRPPGGDRRGPLLWREPSPQRTMPGETRL